jgi:hypothetical protein
MVLDTVFNQLSSAGFLKADFSKLRELCMFEVFTPDF